MEAWLDFAEGPLLRLSLAVLVLGLGRLLLLTGWEILRARARAGDRKLSWRRVAGRTAAGLLPFRPLGEYTVLGITSFTFHLTYLVTPLFLAGHVTLIRRSTGLSWPVLPALAADILTIIAILAGLVLLLSRRIDRQRRLLSRAGDHWLPALLVLVFLTGFTTMHPWANPLSPEAARLAHLLSAQLFMVLAPFTKLSHMVLMPLGFLAGVIGWKMPATAGSAVGRDLGREEKPI